MNQSILFCCGIAINGYNHPLNVPPWPSRKAELAAGIEISYKLMAIKLGNSLTEKFNYCHYFQLICFDLLLGAGNTVIARTRENQSLSVPVMFC